MLANMDTSVLVLVNSVSGGLTAGTVLLRRRSGQIVRAGHRRRALQGLPLRRHRHQRDQRGGHARAVGVPGRPRRRHLRRRPDLGGSLHS
jgi:hypothetical protein